MNDAVIRLCRPDDIDAVSRMEGEWATLNLTFGYVPNSRENLRGRLGPYFLVAEHAGEVVGFVAGSEHVSEGLAVTPAGQRYLEVHDLYVAAEFRDRGTGSRLLEAVLDAARREGIERIQAFSATKDHDRILRFYRRHGFQPWGVQLFR